MTWRQDGHETSAQSRFMISCVNSVEKKDHLLFSFTQRLKELFFLLPASSSFLRIHCHRYIDERINR